MDEGVGECDSYSDRTSPVNDERESGDDAPAPPQIGDSDVTDPGRLIQALYQQIYLQNCIIMQQSMALQQRQAAELIAFEHLFKLHSPTKTKHVNRGEGTKEEHDMASMNLSLPIETAFKASFPTKDKGLSKLFHGINRSCRRDPRDPRRCRVHNTWHEKPLAGSRTRAEQTNINTIVKLESTTTTTPASQVSPSTGVARGLASVTNTRDTLHDEPPTIMDEIMLRRDSESDVENSSYQTANGENEGCENAADNETDSRHFVSIGMYCRADTKDRTRCSVHRIRHRTRTKLPPRDLALLKNFYDENPSPGKRQFYELAQQTKLPIKVLKVWFQNTRRLTRNTCGHCGRIFVTNHLFAEHVGRCNGDRLLKYDNVSYNHEMLSDQQLQRQEEPNTRQQTEDARVGQDMHDSLMESDGDDECIGKLESDRTTTAKLEQLNLFVTDKTLL